MKISTAFEGFVLDLRARRRAEATAHWYDRHVGKAIQTWEDPEVKRVTRDLVRGYLARLDNEPETVKGAFRALRAFFNWAVAEGLVKVSPVRGLQTPAVPKIMKKRFTEAETEKLLKACGKGAEGLRNRAMLLLLMDSGLRASEVLGVTLDRMSLVERWVIVRGKGNKDRQVPLSDRAVQALWRWKAERPQAPTQAVFLSMRGKGPLGYWGLRQVLQRLEARTGVPCNAHKFRYTFATKYAGTGNLFSLQKVLGHSGLEMVRRYAELNFDQVQEDYRKTMGG